MKFAPTSVILNLIGSSINYSLVIQCVLVHCKALMSFTKVIPSQSLMAATNIWNEYANLDSKSSSLFAINFMIWRI